jgi:hypothetical protein
MPKDIVEVRALDEYRLFLRFEDGVSGEIDFAEQVPFDGVFAPLREPKVFEQVRVDSELGTIVWPNGADLDPDVLYACVTGRRVPAERP